MPRALSALKRDVHAHEAAQPHHQTEEVSKIDPTVNDPKPQHLDAPHETVEAFVNAGSNVVPLEGDSEASGNCTLRMVPVERVSDTESTDTNHTENTRPSLGAGKVVPNTDDHLPTQSAPTTTIAAGSDQVISLPVQPLAAAEAITLTPEQAETSPSIISTIHAPAAAKVFRLIMSFAAFCTRLPS